MGRHHEIALRPQRTVPAAFGWQARAACRRADPELFFSASGEDVIRALSVCAACEVRMRCLAFALSAAERFGIWGGMTEKERAGLPADARSRIMEVAVDHAA